MPSPIEQEHIRQALDASQTAMAAIQTLLSLSSWVLGILGVVIALIALFGWVAIRKAALAQSEQIANKRLDTYLQGDDFKDLVAAAIAKSVKDRWQNTVVVTHLAEERKEPGEQSPFPTREANQ